MLYWLFLKLVEVLGMVSWMLYWLFDRLLLLMLVLV